MKMIGIVLLVLLGWAIGYKKSNELFFRVKRLEKLSSCLQELLSRMIYTGTERDDLMETVLVSGGFLTKSGNVFLICDSVFSSEEQKEFLEFINSFGTTDLQTQTKRLNHYLQRIKHKVELSRKKADENAKLYRTVGLCGGVMMGIFLL